MTPKRAPKKGLPPDADGLLARGVVEIIPRDEFLDALRSGRKLRLKLGLDPSKPDLHIGHAVLLRKLRRLQELGHQVVLIVGDWTAQIGDPSGQSITRPMLTAEEVRANAETYMRQFFHVVDRERTEVRWQSEWFGNFTLADVVRLTSRFTVAQMLQRDDFRQRFDAQKPLGVHELLYPLLQAYDSVAIEADVEFGGSDQLFNLLVGRELQEDMGQRPQSCFVMRLLAGTDGAQKMSKSLGNTIDFEDPPGEQYGKVLSIPDSALMDYLELTTDIPDEELAFIRKQLEDRSVNPMEIKKRLAREIVAQFHGAAAAGEAEAEFYSIHADRRADIVVALPDGTVDVKLPLRAGKLNVNFAQLLYSKGLTASVAQARRLIAQGAVERFARDEAGRPREIRVLLARRVRQPMHEVSGGEVYRVGKHRFLRIVDVSKSS